MLVEVLMCRDHLDMIAYDRGVLRRQARQVQRVEAAHEAERPWPAQEALWFVAPRVPGWLRESVTVTLFAPGCYRVGPAWFQLLWVAANELPLLDELVPFLVARSGRALDEFVAWVAPRRPLEWVMDMVKSLDMSDSVREDLKRRFGRQDDPIIEARRQDLLRTLLANTPEVRQEIIEEAMRAALSRVLARRGLALSPEQEARIAACEDLQMLERWLDQAVTAATVEEALF